MLFLKWYQRHSGACPESSRAAGLPTGTPRPWQCGAQSLSLEVKPAWSEGWEAGGAPRVTIAAACHSFQTGRPCSGIYDIREATLSFKIKLRAITVNTCHYIYIFVNTHQTYSAKSEPSGKLWTVGENGVSVEVPWRWQRHLPLWWGIWPWHVWGQVIMKKISVPSVQFCYEPKSALKQTVYLFIFFKKRKNYILSLDQP